MIRPLRRPSNAAHALILATLVLGLASCGGSDTPAAPPAAALPDVVLLITNEFSGDLSVIDPATRQVVATIPLGKRPRGLDVSPDRQTVYVALSGSPVAGPGVDESTLPPPDRSADGIGVVDLREGRLVRVLKAGTDPEQVAVSRDGTLLFVANEDAAQVSVVNASSGEIVQTYPVGEEPEGVTVSPDGRHVYVTSEDEGTVYVFEVSERRMVAKLEVGARPRSIAFLPDGSRAYITNENSASVSVIDARALTLLPAIALENMRPMGVVSAPDGRYVAVSTGRSRAVVLVDPATGAITGSIDAGERPWGIAVSPDGTRLYTANGPSNDVSVIDVATRAVVARIPAGDRPWGALVVDRRGR
jgi:YVTN family beta-propeller protein